MTSWPLSHAAINASANLYVFSCRSLPKLSSQDEDGPQHREFSGVVNFEPIPHDHDFCERVVINVKRKLFSPISLDPPLCIFFPLLAFILFLSRAECGGGWCVWVCTPDLIPAAFSPPAGCPSDTHATHSPPQRPIHTVVIGQRKLGAIVLNR